jgi:DNA-binding Lrp family transcriptional regulator
MVARQLLGRRLLLDTVLYRESYCALLPKVVREVPESGDLGLLCAYQNFSELEQSYVLKVWQAVSPRQHFGDITYDAPVSFPLFNRVTEDTFLARVLPYFDELEPAVTPLTSREYVELLEAFMLNYASPLSEQELKILHLLQEEPNATLQDLREHSSLSLGCLSSHLARFKEKLLLSRFYRINFPRIGLNHVAVLAYPSPGSRINRYLEQCPYLRKIHRFGGAGTPYLITYAFPRLRLRRLREWLQELVGLGHLARFRMYLLDGVFQGYNLRSYLARKSDVPVAERFRWVAWIRYLRDVLIRQGFGEVLAQPYTYRYSPPNVDVTTLDAVDYQLLSYMSPDASAGDLAQLLGESVHVVRRRTKELFAQEVLFERPDLSMFHLGLNESIFVLLEGSEEIVQSFLAGCREAPLYGGSVFSHPTPGCIVAFGLPTGLALKVGQELGRLFLEQQEFDAAVFYGSGSKDFSVASVLGRCRFDQAKRQWTWHREYLPTTFDYVSSPRDDRPTDEEEDQYDDQAWNEGEPK